MESFLHAVDPFAPQQALRPVTTSPVAATQRAESKSNSSINHETPKLHPQAHPLQPTELEEQSFVIETPTNKPRVISPSDNERRMRCIKRRKQYIKKYDKPEKSNPSTDNNNNNEEDDNDYELMSSAMLDSSSPSSAGAHESKNRLNNSPNNIPDFNIDSINDHQIDPINYTSNSYYNINNFQDLLDSIQIKAFDTPKKSLPVATRSSAPATAIQSQSYPPIENQNSHTPILANVPSVVSQSESEHSPSRQQHDQYSQDQPQNSSRTRSSQSCSSSAHSMSSSSSSISIHEVWDNAQLAMRGIDTKAWIDMKSNEIFSLFHLYKARSGQIDGVPMSNDAVIDMMKRFIANSRVKDVSHYPWDHFNDRLTYTSLQHDFQLDPACYQFFNAFVEANLHESPAASHAESFQQHQRCQESPRDYHSSNQSSFHEWTPPISVASNSDEPTFPQVVGMMMLNQHFPHNQEAQLLRTTPRSNLNSEANDPFEEGEDNFYDENDDQQAAIRQARENGIVSAFQEIDDLSQAAFNKFKSNQQKLNCTKPRTAVLATSLSSSNRQNQVLRTVTTQNQQTSRNPSPSKLLRKQSSKKQSQQPHNLINQSSPHKERENHLRQSTKPFNTNASPIKPKTKQSQQQQQSNNTYVSKSPSTRGIKSSNIKSKPLATQSSSSKINNQQSTSQLKTTSSNQNTKYHSTPPSRKHLTTASSITKNKRSSSGNSSSSKNIINNEFVQRQYHSATRSSSTNAIQPNQQLPSRLNQQQQQQQQQHSLQLPHQHHYQQQYHSAGKSQSQQQSNSNIRTPSKQRKPKDTTVDSVRDSRFSSQHQHYQLQQQLLKNQINFTKQLKDKQSLLMPSSAAVRATTATVKRSLTTWQQQPQPFSHQLHVTVTKKQQQYQNQNIERSSSKKRNTSNTNNTHLVQNSIVTPLKKQERTPIIIGSSSARKDFERYFKKNYEDYYNEKNNYTRRFVSSESRVKPSNRIAAHSLLRSPNLSTTKKQKLQQRKQVDSLSKATANNRKQVSLYDNSPLKQQQMQQQQQQTSQQQQLLKISSNTSSNVAFSVPISTSEFTVDEFLLQNIQKRPNESISNTAAIYPQKLLNSHLQLQSQNNNFSSQAQDKENMPLNPSRFAYEFGYQQQQFQSSQQHQQPLQPFTSFQKNINSNHVNPSKVLPNMNPHQFVSVLQQLNPQSLLLANNLHTINNNSNSENISLSKQNNNVQSEQQQYQMGQQQISSIMKQQQLNNYNSISSKRNEYLSELQSNVKGADSVAKLNSKLSLYKALRNNHLVQPHLF